MRYFLFVVSMLAFAFAGNAKGESKLPDSYAFTRGVEAYEDGNNKEALNWLNKEVSEHPDNGYAFIYISAVRYENSELGKALTAINLALKKLPKKDKEYMATAYGTRALIYLVMEDTISALKDCDAAIKFEPDNKDHYEHRGHIYYKQGRYDLADADFKKMISLDPGDVMGYMGLGRNARDQKLYDEALAQFSHVIKLSPDYDSGYSFRAECYLAQKKYSEALDDIIRALSISADRKAYFHLITLDEEALPIAKAKLQLQANKNPNEAEWYYYLGRVYEANDKLPEAISYFEQAYKIDADAAFLERMARCYFEMGNYATALDYTNRAIDMDGNDQDFLMLKGNILNEMGNYPEAIAELDKYVAKNPDDYFGYYRRGWFKDEANDVDGAIEDYTMSITLEPRYAYAYLERGKFYLEQGKVDLAKDDFEKVIELDTIPNLGSSCAHFAYYYLGQRDKAVAFMDSLIAEDDDRAGTYYDAACLYSVMNEKETAIDYLTKAFEQGYRRIAHTYADHDLDNIRELPEFKALLEKYSSDDFSNSENISRDELALGEMEIVEIPFTKESGVTKVKCTINGLPLHFVFDTGAADVTISMVEANFMMKNDYIKPEDVLGTARYMDANGDISEGTVINLRNVDFGGLELNNVRASVVRNQKAPLLLGQSVLGRLGKIEIDNPNKKLIISHNVRK